LNECTDQKLTKLVIPNMGVRHVQSPYLGGNLKYSKKNERTTSG